MALSVSIQSTYINVASGTGSLEDLYQTIYDLAGGAETYMTKIGAGPYIYEILGNKLLYLRGGSVLNINNPGDELRWTLSISAAPVLYSFIGSELNVVEGCTLNFNNNAPASGIYTYIYMSGKIRLEGTIANPITLKNYSQFRLYSSVSDAEDRYFNNVRLGYITYSASFYYLSFYQDTYSSYSPVGIFKNITIDGEDRGVIVFSQSSDLSKVLFDNFITDRVYSIVTTQGSNLKFSNSSFKKGYYYNSIYGLAAQNRYYRSSDAYKRAESFQPKITFENCVFEDNYTSVATKACFHYNNYNTIIKFKNCTFSGNVYIPMNRGAAVGYGTSMLWEGENIFTNITEDRYWHPDYNGQHLHVFPLEMHVVDRNNNYIEGANVGVAQSEGKEDFQFVTYDSPGNNPSGDPVGNIRDLFGDNPVFVHREETSTGVYENWSDDISAGRYHQITISKPGYKLWTRNVTFDQDVVITAVLEPEGKTLSLPVTY